MSRSPCRLAVAGLAIGAALLSSHCQRDVDTPADTAAAGCCELTPNAALPERKGRLVVSYPGDGAAGSTRLEVYAAGDTQEPLAGEYGNAALELPPGRYDVIVGGRRVAGVGVQAGHDTRIRAGALHVYAGDGTRIDLRDDTSGEAVDGGYGERQYGLPVGPVVVEVAGQRETALIEDGKITEF